jgi:aspartate racemase
MKMLGLIGGMSWESTALYYRIINTEIRQARGKLHSARLLIYSFDFEEIAALQKAGRWDEAARKMIEAGNALKAGGAEALMICTNTMHLMAAEVEAATGLPLIHIADCTGEEIMSRGLAKVGLLGTQFTMEQPFYRKRLEEKFDIEVVIPDEGDRLLAHSVIFEELCKGIVNPASRKQYERIIGKLKDKGAQGIILGCTELGLLIQGQKIAGLPIFDTTDIHAKYAAKHSMG